jgi:hypothetical protein
VTRPVPASRAGHTLNLKESIMPNETSNRRPRCDAFNLAELEHLSDALSAHRHNYTTYGEEPPRVVMALTVEVEGALRRARDRN